MTHLPEAEVIRKGLERHVVGKRFKDISVKSASTVGRHRNRPEFIEALQGRKVEGVTRRGTQLVLGLDDGKVLVIALGPEGALTRETATAEGGPQTQAVCTFTTGGALHLVDAAKEAEMFVASPEDLDSPPGGVDPLAGTFTWHAFGHHLSMRKEPLAVLLRDDSFILGLGDVYADEILWSAGLAGNRISASLSSQEIRRLYRAIFEVLYEAVKQGDADEGDGPSVDLDGDVVAVPEGANVYGRKGQACPRCRRPITRVEVTKDVRTYHCESCQT